ncbi:hypothetical protein M513_03223, partial [Trichuris suis]
MAKLHCISIAAILLILQLYLCNAATRKDGEEVQDRDEPVTPLPRLPKRHPGPSRRPPTRVHLRRSSESSELFSTSPERPAQPGAFPQALSHTSTLSPHQNLTASTKPKRKRDRAREKIRKLRRPRSRTRRHSRNRK